MNKKREKITYKKLVNYLTKQPYLVWNTIEMALLSEEDDTDSFEDAFDFDDFFDNEVETTTISQVQAKMFGHVEKKMIGNLLQNEGAVYISGSTTEEKFVKTMEAIFDISISKIIGGTLIYEENGFDVVASFTLLDKDEKKWSNLKISTSTKRKDLIKYYYDYFFFETFKNKFNITEFETKFKTKLQKGFDLESFQIQYMSIFILATKLLDKGEIDFFESHYVNTNASGRSDSEAIKSWNFYDCQLKKAGMGSNSKGLDEPFTILQLIRDDANDEIFFESYDYYIDKIIDLKTNDRYPSLIPISKYDNQFFGKEPELKKILEISKSPYSGWSGKVIPLKIMVDNPIDDESQILMLNTPTAKEFYKNRDKDVYIESDEKIEFISELIKRIENGINVWYDFEGFSLTMAPLRGTLPFQQIVAQVSIITTKGIEKYTTGVNDNFVYDTLNYSNDFYVDIIKNIYNSEANSYIVFNKAYENARLKEMVVNLEYNNHPEWEKCSEMVETIIEKTVDLLDCFSCSLRKTPVILIPSLKGLYSIKKVEKFITEKYPHLLDLEFSNVSYSSLDIKNGAQAMDILNNRALGNIGDNSWVKQKEFLKKYCENDVKSMITVYYLIKELRQKYN